MPQLDLADHTINYVLSGPDIKAGTTPVALIHGLGANLAFWRLGAVRHLGEERPLIMHDLKGHGSSGMPVAGYRLDQLAGDLNCLLDSLGAEKVHIVGHSHGARVALTFALDHPERVASLTLADTQISFLQKPMRLGEWPHWPRWKADLIAQGVTTFPDEDREIDFSLLAELGPRGGSALAGEGPLPRNGPRMARAAGGPVRRAEAMSAAANGGPVANGARMAEAGPRAPGGINLRSRQMGTRSAAKWNKLLEATSAKHDFHDETVIRPERFTALTMPVLLMYGETTHCLPTSDKLLELLPQARRVIVPGAGHFFPIVKPRFFARTLRMFLAGVEAEDPPPSYDRRRLAARMHMPGARGRRAALAAAAALRRDA
ncbi:alpha/beta fold hydrolase [Pseudoroseicyclus sp. H15]